MLLQAQNDIKFAYKNACMAAGKLTRHGQVWQRRLVQRQRQQGGDDGAPSRRAVLGGGACAGTHVDW